MRQEREAISQTCDRLAWRWIQRHTTAGGVVSRLAGGLLVCSCGKAWNYYHGDDTLDPFAERESNA